MTNILKEQQEKNKNSLEEIKTLKKQLADKEENFKLRIWNAVHSLTESSEYTGVTLRILESSTWPEHSGLSLWLVDNL